MKNFKKRFPISQQVLSYFKEVFHRVKSMLNGTLFKKNQSFRGDDDEGHLLMTMYVRKYVLVYVGKTLYEVLLVHVTIC